MTLQQSIRLMVRLCAVVFLLTACADMRSAGTETSDGPASSSDGGETVGSDEGGGPRASGKALSVMAERGVMDRSSWNVSTVSGPR